MIDLHQRLQELAGAARDGVTPGPAHAVRRGRQRRRRIVAVVASVLAVALVAGVAGSGRTFDQRAPAPEVPTVTRPTPSTLSPLPDLKVLHDNPRPGSGGAGLQAARHRVATMPRRLLHPCRPDLLVIDSGDRYPVNFFVGFFRQGPTSPQQGGWAAATVTALDVAGRTVVSCRVGPQGDGTPKCPAN